jgi:hypothetical protein
MGSIAPSFDAETNIITIPKSTWASYYIDGEKVKGVVVIDEETTVTAEAKPPAHFRDGTEAEWTFTPGLATEVITPVDDDVAFEPESVE